MKFLSHEEVLNFLEDIIKRKVKDEYYLNELEAMIRECRKEKIVTIRAIDECFFEYRARCHDYEAFSEEERRKWDEVLSNWQ